MSETADQEIIKNSKSALAAGFLKGLQMSGRVLLDPLEREVLEHAAEVLANTCGVTLLQDYRSPTDYFASLLREILRLKQERAALVLFLKGSADAALDAMELAKRDGDLTGAEARKTLAVEALNKLGIEYDPSNPE